MRLEQDILTLLSATLSILCLFVVPLGMWWLNRTQATRDKQMEKRAEARKRESIITMRMIAGIGELTMANTTAIKNGKPNGETEAALKVFSDAKRDMETFFRDMAAEHLN